MVLPETTLPAAKEVAERLRARFSTYPLDTNAGPFRVTISLGRMSLSKRCAELF